MDTQRMESARARLQPSCFPRPHLARSVRVGLLAAAAFWAGTLTAQVIPVPNGDFSAASNNGSIGGGPLGGSGMDVVIGSGPWTGTYAGVLGLLSPPTLTVDSSQQIGQISGVAGVLSVVILNNRGYFSQVVPTAYQFGRFYLLSSNIDIGAPTTLAALTTANVGIALRSGASTLAASTTAAAGLVDLDLIQNTRYRLRLGYLADMAATGNIGVQLFNQPQGLLTPNLAQTSTFGAVTLEARDIGLPTSIEVGSFGLTADVNQPFGDPIIAIVRDAEGDGVPGLTVTFTAPTMGASATLSSPTGGSGTTVTAITDLDGMAVVFAVANGEAGCYRVTAQSSVGTLDQAVFHLRNRSNNPGVDSIYCNGFQ